MEAVTPYRLLTADQVLKDPTVDSGAKAMIVKTFANLGWISDFPHTIFVAALCEHWEIAKDLVESSKDMDHSLTLRKLLGNSVVFKDRKSLKDLCTKLFEVDPKAMTKLNAWAVRYGQENGLKVSKYSDLCSCKITLK